MRARARALQTSRVEPVHTVGHRPKFLWTTSITSMLNSILKLPRLLRTVSRILGTSNFDKISQIDILDCMHVPFVLFAMLEDLDRRRIYQVLSPRLVEILGCSFLSRSPSLARHQCQHQRASCRDTLGILPNSLDSPIYTPLAVLTLVCGVYNWICLLCSRPVVAHSCGFVH